MAKINRDFPADTAIQLLGQEIQKTFLTDRQIDAELFAYYQSKGCWFSADKTVSGLKEMRVYKKELDTAKIIGEIVGISQPTYRKHLKYLISSGFIIEFKDYYLLKTTEGQKNWFFTLPLDTVQFLLDTVRKPVIKTLIYLGHQYEWKKAQGNSDGYVFTLQELADYIGEKLNNNSRNYERINNYLIALEKFGFIKISSFIEGEKPKKRIYYLNKKKELLNNEIAV